MNREQFIGFMESPGSLKGDSLVLLEGLLKEFPYCQTARMLYLKTLHNQKSIHYNSQLKITAAYAGNRKNLYQLILQPDLISKINQLEVEVTKNEKKPEIKEKPPITIPKPAFVKPETVKEPPPVTIPKPAIQVKPLERTANKPAENKLTQNTIEPKKAEAKPDTVKEKPPVTIPKPAIQNKPLERTSEKPEENRLTQNIVESKKVEAKLEAVREKPLAKVLKPAIVETKLPGKAVEDTGDKDFTDGIAELEQEILNEAISAAIQSEAPVIHRKLDTIESKESEQKQENEAVDKTGKHSFSEWLKLVNKNKTQEKESITTENEEKAKLNELVERFINEEPKIRPKKTELFSPVNMARLSVVEDWSFVTETLAKVYAKQGNYIKAIKAYENLILKYPEKNAYFAAQIHSLVELKEKNSK